jgi:hypothetical protein
VVGDCLSLSAEVHPGALTMHVPGLVPSRGQAVGGGPS